MNPIIDSYFWAGLNVIPIKRGTKFPRVEEGGVERLRKERANESEYSKWDLPIAINAGEHSGGVVCLDFDDHGSCFEEWKNICDDTWPGSTNNLVIEKTPSGGYHCIYRTDGEIKTQELANKDKSEIKDKKKEKIGLIETRGTGAYFVCAPSDGYVLIQGELTDIKNVSREMHEMFLSAARSLDREKKEEFQSKGKAVDGDTPFNDYDAKNDPIETLLSEGWAIAARRNQTTYLRRPGKQEGISASWNHVPNRFFCFTTSTDFDSHTVYKASAVYAILKCAGDFHVAAGELRKQNYGGKSQPKTTAPPKKVTEEDGVLERAKIVRIGELRERMNTYRQFGAEDKGISTGWKNLDEFYRPAKGQFNLVVGIPGMGKTTWMDSLMINTARNSEWRWVVFSPENYPFERHLRSMVEKTCNCYFSGIDDLSYSDTMTWLEKHFIFIDQSLDGTRLIDILKTTDTIINEWHPDAIITDPWNELQHDIDKGDSETNYIGRQISLARNFSRKRDVAFYVLAHPTKLQKNKETGVYDPPTPYDTAGSSHFYNKSDNCLCVYRHYDTGIVDIIIQKIKFKMYGKLGTAKFTYDVPSGNYIEYNEFTDGAVRNFNNE